jgi:hypothetical protein
MKARKGNNRKKRPGKEILRKMKAGTGNSKGNEGQERK